jgi:hypothetical protein
VVAERRPTYWEWRAELEVQRTRWQRIALGLGLAVLSLVELLVYQGLRPRPIYYVTTTRGAAEPGHVPEAVVEGFAARVVGLLGNLTPATAAAGYEQSRRYLSPKLVDLLHTQAQEDLKRITDQQLATAFAIHQATIEPRGEAWRVSLRGTRQSWSRSQFLGEDRMRYTLEVALTPVSDLNPWGLQVSGLRLERDTPDRDPRAAARCAE